METEQDLSEEGRVRVEVSEEAEAGAVWAETVRGRVPEVTASVLIAVRECLINKECLVIQ